MGTYLGISSKIPEMNERLSFTRVMVQNYAFKTQKMEMDHPVAIISLGENVFEVRTTDSKCIILVENDAIRKKPTSNYLAFGVFKPQIGERLYCARLENTRENGYALADVLTSNVMAIGYLGGAIRKVDTRNSTYYLLVTN